MMLSLIRGLLGGRKLPETSPPEKADEPVVLSFRLPLPSQPQPVALPETAGDETAGDETAGDETASPSPLRTKKRRAMTLRAAGLGSAVQRRALRTVEIRTTADLLAANLQEVVRRAGLPDAAAGTLRRWQRAIRMARQFPEMTPREALMLRAIHRSTLRSIAAESAPRLRRDLTRFAMSTEGNRLLGENPLPTPQTVRRWIEVAKSKAQC